MTAKQMEDLRAFAAERIQRAVEKARPKLGNGIYQYNMRESQVLFLDDVPQVIPPKEEAVWVVYIYGTVVSVGQGEINVEPPGESVSWNNSVTSDEKVLFAANSRQAVQGFITNSTFRASYVEVEPPASGYALTKQTLYLSIPDFQFSVRLTLAVRYENSEEVIREDSIDFYSGSEQVYEVALATPGEAIVVTASAITRL